MQEYPVTIEFPVHWGEMDALGHVNHTRFLVWMESARIALFEQIGLMAQGQPEVGPILANINVDYLAPVHHPATIVCGTRVTGLGNTSFTLEYGVSLNDRPDILVARASSVIVLVNYVEGRKVELSPDLRDALEALR